MLKKIKKALCIIALISIYSNSQAQCTTVCGTVHTIGGAPSGTQAVVITGTPNVNVINTVTVTGSVKIINTVPVTITGTANVNVTNTVTSQITGTANVNVTNTVTANITGTTNVNVTSSTLPGNVPNSAVSTKLLSSLDGTTLSLQLAIADWITSNPTFKILFIIEAFDANTLIPSVTIIFH